MNQEFVGDLVVNLAILCGFLAVLGVGGLIADYVSRISRSFRGSLIPCQTGTRTKTSSRKEKVEDEKPWNCSEGR